MSHNIEIKEGAFVVSDAHYSDLHPELLLFIENIHSKKLQPTQLILMGDIFDALFGTVSIAHKLNTRMIELLNEISEDMEVIYLEGNHDFNLQKIFPFIKVFSIRSQPVRCTYKDKVICLAHGDFNGGFGYSLYSTLIRSYVILFVLGLINKITNNAILKAVDKYLTKKNDCQKFTNFQNFTRKRLESKHECDFFIEGHFHQDESFEIGSFKYINLAAFACNQRYFIVKSLQDKELLRKEKCSEEI